VRYRRDVPDRARGDGGIAQVAPHPLGARIEVIGALAVGGGQERVDDADVVTGCEQRVDDVRADKARAAGDEDRPAHGWRRVRVCNPLVASTA
jgi:hypothetical protein